MNFYRSDFKHKIYGLYTGKYGSAIWPLIPNNHSNGLLINPNRIRMKNIISLIKGTQLDDGLNSMKYFQQKILITKYTQVYQCKLTILFYTKIIYSIHVDD